MHRLANQCVLRAACLVEGIQEVALRCRAGACLTARSIRLGAVGLCGIWLRGQFRPAVGCQHIGRILHGADDLVIARTPAKIARKLKTDLMFRGPRVCIQQGLGRHDESRRADAALQRGVFQKALLDRMRCASVARPSIVVIFAPRPQRPAPGSYRPAARQAVRCTRHNCRCCSLLRAGQSERIAQHFKQALPGFAQELDRLAVDRRRDVYSFAHRVFLDTRFVNAEVDARRMTLHAPMDQWGGFARPRARSVAIASVRWVSTPARCLRYSAVPRLSLIGRAACRAARRRRQTSRAWPVCRPANPTRHPGPAASAQPRPGRRGRGR